MRYLLLSIFIILSSVANSQSLIEKYHNDTILLIPDGEYASSIDWDSLYKSYPKYQDSGPHDSHVKIAVSDNGDTYMSFFLINEIWKFDDKGNLTDKLRREENKRFGSIKLVLGDSLIITYYGSQQINVLNINGTVIKTFPIDFYPRAIELKDAHTLAVAGIKNNVSVEYVLIDISSGTIKSLFSEEVMSKQDFKGYLPFYLPTKYSHKHPLLSISSRYGLIVGNPETGSFKIIDFEGYVKDEFMPDITPIILEENDIKSHYQWVLAQIHNSIERTLELSNLNEKAKLKRIKTMNKSIEAMTPLYLDINNYYPRLPYFSKILFDNEENLLVFEFTRAAESENKLSVVAIDQHGEIVARTNLLTDEYQLMIPTDKFIFHNGYIYALCRKKADKESPLELKRFRLSIR